MTLLNTRKGNYAAACALDFLNPPWNWIDAKSRGFHPAGRCCVVSICLSDATRTEWPNAHPKA